MRRVPVVIDERLLANICQNLYQQVILASYTWEDAADALTALSDEAIIEQVGAFDTQVPVVDFFPKKLPSSRHLGRGNLQRVPKYSRPPKVVSPANR